MMRKGCLFLSLSLIVTLAGSAFAGNQGDSLLKLPLLPPVEEIRNLPLTSALSNLGSRAKGGYVLFGVEVLLRQGKEPTVSLPRESVGDLGTALREILRQLPSYEMQVVSTHLIEILPRRARTGSRDLLNDRVADFTVTDTPAAAILAHPARFIPQLQARLRAKQAPGTHRLEIYSGPYALPVSRITLHMKDVTVREILDRVSEATEDLGADQDPLGWTYKMNSDDTPGVPKHAWETLSGLPRDWREYRGSGKASH